jgi:hypothetical protein
MQRHMRYLYGHELKLSTNPVARMPGRLLHKPACQARGYTKREKIIMAKFIQIQVPTERYTGSARDLDSYYINVEAIRFVAQNAQNPDRSSIHFVGGEHSLQLLESAANFVKRLDAD